jgi:aminoglycoside/choline kinase family phosphotransferase
MTDSTPVFRRVATFLQEEFPHRYAPEKVSPLQGDASTRQYFRYQGDDQSFILAVYPDLFDPENFNYRQIHDLFREIGLPVPKIITLEPKLGIVLQEDLGDETLQQRLAVAHAPQRKHLLSTAIDHIATIQREGIKALRPEYQAAELAFDQETLNWELLFFRRHYLEDYRRLNQVDENQLREEFYQLTVELSRLPRCLCHRDYQVRNLMIRDDTLYITDFQDARWGPFSYDLAALLKDSIELAEEEMEKYQDYYLSQGTFPGQPKDFLRQFQLMCIQRLLKALGTYGYQIAVSGKDIYRQYLPGSLQRVLDSLQSIPEFPYIQSIIEKELDP